MLKNNEAMSKVQTGPVSLRHGPEDALKISGPEKLSKPGPGDSKSCAIPMSTTSIEKDSSNVTVEMFVNSQRDQLERCAPFGVATNVKLLVVKLVIPETEEEALKMEILLKSVA